MLNLALIDSDSIYFRVACVVVDTKTDKFKARNWKKDMRASIDHTMRNIEQETMADKMMVAIKGRGNFRNEIYKDYKGTRKELHPKVKEALNYGHTYMKENYDAVEATDMEADDLVAIWAAEARSDSIDYFVVGIDKDLLQIPGNHYNFVKRELRFVDDDEAHLLLMRQCLTGDSADNIPGIRGIGPKKADKLLSGIPKERRWNRVRAAWRAHKAGNPELSLRLLQMLTSFEELEVARNQFKRQTPISKPDVLEREEGQD